MEKMVVSLDVKIAFDNKKDFITCDNMDLSRTLKALKNFLNGWKHIRNRTHGLGYCVEFRFKKNFALHLLIIQSKKEGIIINVHEDISQHHSKRTIQARKMLKRIMQILSTTEIII
jgi:hypothetical protein